MKRTIFVLALALLLAIAAGAVFGQDAGDPVRGGTLRAAWQSEWDGLDPHVASSLSTFQIMYNVLERLVTLDDEGNLIPSLATEWEQSEDGLTWTFTLREGVQFSNGREFTAEDVKWTFDRILDPETGSGQASSIGPEGTVVNVVNERTIEVVHPEPFGAFLFRMAPAPALGIVAQESLEDDGTIAVPIGTGPFMIAEVEGTNFIRLERNENYWQEDLPYLDAIEITPIPDDTVRETALLGDEVDWVIQVAPQSVEALRQDPDIVVPTGPQASYDYIGVNLEREPFDDIRVRQAIAIALDRQTICEAAFFGFCEPIQSPIHDENPWHFDYEPYDRDLEEARQLLADAGFPDGFELELLPTTQFQETVRAAQVIQQNLAEIGIEASIFAPEWSEWLELEGNHMYDLYICNWNGLVDPDQFYFLQHHTGEVFNFTGYSNPAFDALVEEGREVADFQERFEIYQEANQILVDDAPYIYMYNKQDFRAHRADVQGYVLRPDQNNKLWTVWLEGDGE